MPSAGVVEGVDIGFDFLFSVAAGFVDGAPDQLGFDGFKDGFDHGVVIAITFARHGLYPFAEGHIPVRYELG